jgi:CDP-4-dehydro-6-deoxyglucose reductase/ferredoxin-NAD(P)+ reductase (naphthalene dioxygenase ferredoxin-specific)
MAHRVRIENLDREIAVENGATILETALAAGLDYPFMCQQGQCGSCRSILLEGEVELGHLYNPLVLTEADRARGFILACQARPRSDCVVAIAEMDGLVTHPMRDLACVVAARDPVTPTTTILRLQPIAGGPLIFSAGQYASLRFPGQEPRDYSMANRPDEDLLEFHIQRMAGGTVSEHVATGLKVGDPVALRGPFGAAYLREEHLGPILLAAGGTGLAPLMSILRAGQAIGMNQRFYLYAGGRRDADLYNQDRLRELQARHRNLTVVTSVSEPEGANGRRHGHVSDIVAADFADLSAFQAYAAGPPEHCDAVRRVCLARGLPAECFFADPFVTARPR